jgi:ATP-binding cassette subfamily B protein RaxB
MSLQILQMRKRVKTILQNEAMECGLACVAMIANYHKHDISVSYLRSLVSVSMRGLSLADIVELAGRLDLDAQGFAVSNVGELKNLRCPALLHWNGDHFVVLEEVSRGGVFKIHDPAFGLRIYTRDDVERHFSGVALEFEPRVDFSSVKAKDNSVFWEVFRSCRGLEHVIAIITVLSFAASLFSLATPILLEIALDVVIPQFDLDLLTIVMLGLGLFMSFEALSRWLRDVVTARAATMFEIHFTRNIIGHAFRLPLRYFEARHTGDFVTRLSSIDHIKTFIVSGFIDTIADGVMSFMVVLLMFYYSPSMAFVSILTLAAAIVLRLVTYPKIAMRTLETLEARSEEQALLLDGLRRIDSLKAHNTAEFFGLKWFENFARFANKSYASKKLSIDTDLLLHLIFMIGTVVTLYMGVSDTMKSTISLGVLYAFFTLRNSFFFNMNAMILSLLNLSIMRVHFNRLDDILSEKTETHTTGATIARPIRRKVSLRGVSVAFGQNTKPLLSNVDFDIDIARGESLAIVGPSGCGKSSLLKIVASLHHAEKGQFLVDDRPLEEFGLYPYRMNVGAVFADDGVIAGSVLDNLSMFSPSIAMSTIEEALETVGLLDDVLRLPQGLATRVTNESAILSTGQRRRLLLARALCRRPRLLLLDEVTANLDAASEERLVKSLMAFPAAKLFVTHSEKLLPMVDRVYRIENGGLSALTAKAA